FVGHYHPPIDGRSYTYPGSLEPLRFGEERQGGIVIAEVAPGGRIERARIVVTQTRLWDERVDVGGATNAHEIVERVRAALLGKDGLARVTLTGELDPEVDLRFEDVARSVDGIHVLVRAENLSPAYDLDEIAQEQTVRGQFVRDLLDADLDDALKQRAIVTGLRALEGRDDLEVET
ncbi:MAG: hypothetical protein NZL88_09735, partial [Gaiellaceae bacterium]|nr:hypothetical protein [Gaiellaceae bacterium]